MEKKEKDYNKLKLATCLRKILEKNKDIHKTNKEKGIYNPRLVYSLRKLEADTGQSYNLIQRTFSGESDVYFTSMLTLIDSLNVSFSDFAVLFEKLPKSEVDATIAEIVTRRKKKWDNSILSLAAEEESALEKKIKSSRKTKKNKRTK